MTIGRAEATLIADVIDAQQRALGRPLTRNEMDDAIAVAAQTAEMALREDHDGAFIALTAGHKR